MCLNCGRPVENKLTQSKMMRKCNEATNAMATTLVDVFFFIYCIFCPQCLLFLPNSSLSFCLSLPSFPLLLPDRRTAAILTANEGQGFCCFLCVFACVYNSLREKRHRESAFVCVRVYACLCWDFLQKGKARSRKRKSEKDKGRCALQLSSLDLFPLCY